MATTFISRPAEDHPVITSQLYSVKARTDKSKVSVRVVRNPDGQPDEFFSTTLYPFDGIVELAELGKLIEEQFRIKNRIYDTISVSIDDISTSFTAIYCEYDVSPEFDHASCFWTASATGIVHSDSAVSLSHWPDGSDLYLVKVVGIEPDGNIAMVERRFSRSSDAPWVSFSVSEIIQFALAESATPLAKVSYFAISHGDIQKVFYIVDDPAYLLFRFRNIFNAPEYLDVVGTVKRKTVADRDIAVCSGIARHYNRRINRTYELSTGPLTIDQTRALEQLISSHQVQLCADTGDYDILVTDHDCTADNDDQSLLSMKFTFRFTGDRPLLFDADMEVFLRSGSRIFSEQFTAEFA